ncbi:TOMM system kinase/cyclase fusion protein [Pseudoalteromonas luteoviolacea]|uniref:Uncharacterized protein n=1 Tax=Pseudoalteromonas luteoviolacea DSM 6061 TaxID=1365250 RepID=A0A161XTA6_9GAMM|nr:TOMM system kinase/cyclase fusion protein [Pseudoalteromonas luteoviolacea]KZN29831.1 hypothetical protein N475_25300 [Pseudoalteromonas luteoviolacea DSM 6061]MBE0389671.1 serine/threonine-protein kinase PpkA [Pseudoalteromonas luteoviolacea DSM 6061]
MSLTHFSDPYIENRFDSTQYELLYKIGEGGFGKVYKARNKNTDQTVAIKFLALEPHLEEAKKKRYIERFKRETALSGQLEHPHIVRLLDKGQVDEHLLFGVFEYVEGQSLREYLMQEGALDAVNATDIMLQVLDALIHAHKKGIIHRDIKPANIMLSQSGAKTHAKILDFGIGTLTQENRHQDFSTITLTQETIGTPSYSAPEQLRGEPASEKTDLYVWGLVLLECLTGMPAVTGSSVASIYHKQLSDVHIPIPSALLGHPLSGLLRRVLQKNATERVISGQEIFSELNLMNVSNLVGILADVQAQHGYDDNTVVLRNDDPNSPLVHDYTTLTERKQITVLALRLSAKRLNDSAKDLDIIDTLFKSQRNHCIDIATRFGAYHVGNLADTMLFYFGYPVASDNDTRLCARTALEAISELSKRNALMQEAHGIQLNAHIGIHSGIFVTYANAVPEGNVANTAMDLSRLAGERQILCSAESRAILEPYSDFDYFDNVQLGLSFEQLSIYNLKGEKRIEAFGFMRGTKTNHKLIGRQLELDKTLSVINGENNTRIAHIYGEAGIGKSRLLQEVRSNASKYQHLVAQCLPEHQNNALYPILNLVRYLFNTDNQPATNIIQLFRDILNEFGLASSEIDATLPVLMVWLAIPLPDEMQTSSHSPDEQKSLLFAGLSALLLSRKSSITEFKLYIIEDIHWSDTVTLEFLRHFACQLQDGSVMISTSRQPCPNSLLDLTLVEIELNKLTTKATADFIEQLFESKNVSENVRSVLVKRTDGIPLFIEELVDMLKEKQLIHESNGAITFINPDKLEQVPNSLRESLQQKLDNLIHAKETAQLAATIGREFEYELLISASSLSEDQIQNDLNELLEKELIIQQRRVDTDSYIFKHALVRDAAYDSMDNKAKTGNHLKIAHTLQTFANNFSVQFAQGEHFEKALAFTDAFKVFLKVGKTSTSESRFQQAQVALEKANSIATEHKSKLEIAEQEVLDLQLSLANFYIGFKGYASPEVHANYNKAIDIAQNIEGTPELSRTLWGIGVYYMVRGNFEESIQTSKQAYESTKSIETVDQVALNALVAGSKLWLGHYEEAEQVYEQNHALFDAELDAQFNQNYSYNIGIAELSYYAICCVELGKKDLALQLSAKAISTAQAIGNVFSHSHALTRGALIKSMLGDTQGALKYAEQAIQLTSEHNIALWNIVANLLEQFLLIQLGQQRCSEALNKWINAYESTGALANLPCYLLMLAKAEQTLGNTNQSSDAQNKALEISQKTGETFYMNKLFEL